MCCVIGDSIKGVTSKMIKTYKVLEFDKILAQLSSYTSSEPVIDRIKNMKMLPEKEAVKAQRETTEAVAAMLRCNEKNTDRGNSESDRAYVGGKSIICCKKNENIYRRFGQRS